MKLLRYSLIITIACGATLQASKAAPEAEWSVLTYIQADNDLASFADYNINDMQKVGSTDKVNILVQWDQPNNQKTWRYKILKNSKIEDGSLNQEMGINPAAEIVNAMQWVKTNYPAKRYMLVLWNHGNGVLDRVSQQNNAKLPWLAIPGMDRKKASDDRGILYDYTDNSYLGTQDLATVFSQVKTLLGQNIDIVGMDACMMAMLEVAYQFKDYADYLVGSEETEPGTGWPYSPFLAALVKNPTMTAEKLTQQIVNAYQKFYIRDRDYTQSSIRLNQIDNVTTGLNNVLAALQECNTVDPVNTTKMLNRARTYVISFYLPEYRDLYSWYTQLTSAAKTFLKTKNRQAKNAKTTLLTALINASNGLKSAIAANVVGTKFKGAQGLSIYCPVSGPVDSDYLQLAFVNNSPWASLIQNGLIRKK